MVEYKDYINSKLKNRTDYGFDVDRVSDVLYPFQRDITKWSLKNGKSAVFADCGLGKTIIQIEWSKKVIDKTGGKVLIIAPLAVSHQTKKEGLLLKENITICQDQKDITNRINITNYEKIHKFDLSVFEAIVIDESGILKSYSGKFRNDIIDRTRNINYKLACTATPAPNDFMELGNHAEFLNVMSRSEMLAMFFTHDSGDTSKWRIKKHAQDRFWRWVSSWAIMIKKPSDLGYDDNSFTLPKLNIKTHIINCSKPLPGMLFSFSAQTLDERRKARKNSIKERVDMVKSLVSEGQNLIWCDYNLESELAKKAIAGAVEVKGADSPEHKEKSLLGFSSGDIKTLVTKPKIAGWGMNWQSCSNVFFLGLSDSYEQFYQAVRRCWRYGQKKEVNVHVIISDSELSVLENIQRKEKDADRMSEMMVKHMFSKQEKNEYNIKNKIEMEQPLWL